MAEQAVLDSFEELRITLAAEMLDDFRILESIAVQGAALLSRRPKN